MIWVFYVFAIIGIVILLTMFAELLHTGPGWVRKWPWGDGVIELPTDPENLNPFLMENQQKVEIDNKEVNSGSSIRRRLDSI